MSWNPTNRKYYEDLGYNFTKYRDKFMVFVNHLHKGCNKKVSVECDYCGEEYFKRYDDYVYYLDNNLIKKCSCSKCVWIRLKEEKDYKQSLGLLNKDDSGYFTYKENRLKELDNYIKKHKTLNDFCKQGTEGWSLYTLISRYKDDLGDFINQLGYNIDDLFNKMPKKYYNDVNKLIGKINIFINENNRFPTKLEIIHKLKIDQRHILHAGGVYGIKRKMNYIDEYDLVDDKGFYNKSFLEFCVAQFLIKNNVIYKREKKPFPKKEGQYRCDFVLLLIDKIVFVEVWGYEDHKYDEISQNYMNNKKIKL
jgi:hypothetical protein